MGLFDKKKTGPILKHEQIIGWLVENHGEWKSLSLGAGMDYRKPGKRQQVLNLTRKMVVGILEAKEGEVPSDVFLTPIMASLAPLMIVAQEVVDGKRNKDGTVKKESK